MHDAAALVFDQGYAVTEACKSPSVGETALRRWVGQLHEERGGVTPNSKPLTTEQQKVQALKARINRLELE